MSVFIKIGIDPGSVSGAITIIKNGGLQIVGIGSLTEKQLAEVFFQILIDKQMGEVLCAHIERVSVFPQQGAVSGFKFGQNYGFLRGCLVNNRIPFKESMPKGWQKYYSMVRKKTETDKVWKTRLLQVAQNLYPGADIPLFAADSVLLAHSALFDD